MTDILYGAADMRADWCTQGDETCDIASTCTSCELTVCPEHSDEFTTCAGNQDLFHCLDCAPACVECRGAGAEDYEAERGDDQ